MKKKITLLPVLLLGGLLTTSSAMAVNTTHVYFKGKIVESACGLSPDSIDQLIQLGQQPIHIFKAKGDRSPSIPFNIKLTDCNTEIATQAVFTFGSNNDSSGQLFNVEGGATGIGVRILHNGTPINNGDVATTNSIVEGNNIASFSAAFEANVDPLLVPITSGTADSWALLQVTYL
ncbi:type 1 fimbrial protein [Shewanella sp. VB17]|uniref:fimbrial protein n=1 Tax=Shewanella sp. VB17 TaxID=2739432 RepID=UPI001564AF8A|nr:fimbrial protein [Shewanella sp. VB17]NRD74175.1 type 1 fimbrial protein [Shewanella sp. VB17]